MVIQIRKAQASDIQAIHALVEELAIYEKEPDALTATLEDYQRDFKDQIFDAIVAEYDQQIVGATIFYMTYSTWKGRMLYLEDFIITEKYRRRGIGQQLFDAFIGEARQLNARLVKWQVLDWNEPAISFYRKNKAIIETEWYNGKLFLQEN